MRLNTKGFTLIELLAAVTLLGVLSAVAVASFSKAQEKVRMEAYAAMESSAFNAAQTYIENRELIIPADSNNPLTIDINTLVTSGFLPRLEDPRKKGADCHTNSTVKVYKINGSNGKLDEMIYNVTIHCSGYTSTHKDGENVLDGKVFKS